MKTRIICLLACAVVAQEVVACGVDNRCVTPIVKKRIVSESYITNNGKWENIHRIHKLELICHAGFEEIDIPFGNGESVGSLTNIVFNETFSLEKPILIKTLAPYKTGQVRLSFCSREQVNNLTNLVIRYRHFNGTGARWGVFHPSPTLKVSQDKIEWRNGILQTNTRINKERHWYDTSLHERIGDKYYARRFGGTIDTRRLNWSWDYYLNYDNFPYTWAVQSIDIMFFRIKPTPFVVDISLKSAKQ